MNSPFEENGTGGIEVAILESSRELVKLGHEVTILTGASDIPEEKTVEGIKIISVDFLGLMHRTWDGANLSFKRQLFFPFAVLSQSLEKYDIYHGHIYSSGLIANYLAKRSGGIAVNTIHGSYYPVWNELNGPVSAFLYRKAERILAPLLAGISSLQIHTGDYFAKQVLEWNVSLDKIKTIHNGVDLGLFDSDSPAGEIPHIQSKLEEKSFPIILTARRLVKKNGIELLIRSFKIALEKEDSHLLIIGDGPERQKLEELTKELHIDKNVSFLGFIPHEKIAGYLKLADIAAVPSIIEASSLFMLEAMAMAKPVIATNAGGLPEVIDNSMGMLVEPGNEYDMAGKLRELISNPQLRQELGKKAQIHVRNYYSWESVAKKLEEEYTRLLMGDSI
ncbi:MAG: glycosyltransferase family 4 protein [Methanolobus sp.]